MLFFDLCSCLPDSYPDWQIAWRHDVAKGQWDGWRSDERCVPPAAMPSLSPQKPLYRQTGGERREEMGSGQVVLCSLMIVQCCVPRQTWVSAAVHPRVSLHQTPPLILPECIAHRLCRKLDVIDLWLYCERKKRLCEISIFVYLMEWSDGRALTFFHGWIVQIVPSRVMRDKTRPSLSPPNGKCADKNRGRIVKQPDKGGMWQWSFWNKPVCDKQWLWQYLRYDSYQSAAPAVLVWMTFRIEAAANTILTFNNERASKRQNCSWLWDCINLE